MVGESHKCNTYLTYLTSFTSPLMPFWQNVEMLPSASREKSREKPKRSAKEYSKDREKVKEGVQEAKESHEENRSVAEVMLYIELNEDELKEKMKNENMADVVSDFSSYDKKQWGQMQQIFGEANFDLSVTKGEDGQPQISMQIDLPEGNVSEKMQLNQQLQDALITRALGQEE